MVMRVDDEADRQTRFLANFIQERLRGGDVFERVDDRNAVGANNEAGVRAGARGLGGRIVDRGPRAIAEIVKRERRNRRGRLRLLSLWGAESKVAQQNCKRQKSTSHRRLLEILQKKLRDALEKLDTRRAI